MKKKPKIKMDFKHYYICQICAAIRGGYIPADACNTVHSGICPYCETMAICIPYVDYVWPGKKEPLVWD